MRKFLPIIGLLAVSACVSPGPESVPIVVEAYNGDSVTFQVGQYSDLAFMGDEDKAAVRDRMDETASKLCGRAEATPASEFPIYTPGSYVPDRYRILYLCLKP